MKFAVPKEHHPSETRVAMVPAQIKELSDKNAQIVIEKGLGEAIGYPDNEYISAGAAVSEDRRSLLASADIILRLGKTPIEEVPWLSQGSTHISFLDPFRESELVESLAKGGVNVISLEMIPRITRAQKLDALSSQTNLAGYVAVILAAEALDRVLPMMITSAGTISPAQVFIIGAGVAGLQAIATAKRLGARVTAYDIRPAVEEEVLSLGVKFIGSNQPQTESTQGAYAHEMKSGQRISEREKINKQCSQADVVISTARVFGKKPPVIISSDIVENMRGGSVIVDLAVEEGGNVEGSVLNKIVYRNGVKIIGYADLARRVPVDASRMYSKNLSELIGQYWDQESDQFALNLEDEIIEASLVTHNGRVRHQTSLHPNEE